MIHKARQQGVVLVIGIIMLAVMTLLVVTSMQSSGLQELMSGNINDKVTAFEAAESAVRAAEQYLDSGVLNLGAFDSDKSDGLLTNMHDDVWNEIDWLNEAVEVENVVVVDGTGATQGGVKTKPRYVIQHIGPVLSDADRKLNVDSSYSANAGNAMVQMFKITARGTGGSDSSQVILETMYGVSN